MRNELERQLEKTRKDIIFRQSELAMILEADVFDSKRATMVMSILNVLKDTEIDLDELLEDVVSAA